MSSPSNARPRLAIPGKLRRGTKAHDLIAVLPLMLWYGLSAAATLRALGPDLARLSASRPDFFTALDIVSKLAVVLIGTVIVALLILRTPPKSGAYRALPRVAAMLGTYISVGIALLPRANVPPVALAFSTILMIAGTAFAIHSLLHLGRSFSLMPEARQLVTSGPYSVVRHPLYLGEEIAIVGMALQYISPPAAILLAVQIGCQLYRMNCEEDILTQVFPDYPAYKARTYRVVPGVY